MEPLAASSAGAVIRPAASAMQPELSAILRDGRVLAGEVVQSSGDGSVMIAIGRHRVPAESRLLLDPGQHFLFRVVEQGGEPVLHLLGTGDPAVSQLLQALRSVIGDERPVGELLQDLAASLRGELQRPDGARPELRALLEALSAHVYEPKAGGAELRALLERSGIRYEAALAAALRTGVSAEMLDRLRADLKGRLLEAWGRAEEGPLREALARTLAGIEAEQLLNLARQRAGEPAVWSFPIQDGEGWTTAQLLVPPQSDDDGENGEGGSGEGTSDLVLGVSFSHLGPIRAEFSWRDTVLGVRVFVTRPELVSRLQTDFGELAKLMSDGKRAVHLFTRVATPAEVDVASSPLDIQFLREHRLMDMSG